MYMLSLAEDDLKNTKDGQAVLLDFWGRMIPVS